MKHDHEHTTEELNEIVSNRAAEELAEQDAANQKRAGKVANMVMRRLSKGQTDMPARAGILPPFLAYDHLDAAVQPHVKEILGKSGIEVDFYNTYKGAGDDEDRIAVTRIGDKEIEPTNPDYQFELHLRSLDQRHDQE